MHYAKSNPFWRIKKTMVKNKHKNMELKKIWLKPNEFRNLLNAIDDNDKNLVIDILLKIKKRGDLNE